MSGPAGRARFLDRRRLRGLVAVALLPVLGGCLSPPESQPLPAGPCSERALPEAGAIEMNTALLGGTGGYPVYRIPALVTAASGALVAFAEGRTSLDDPGAGEIELVMTRSLDCGHTWSEPEPIDEHGDGDAHNPTVIAGVDAAGTPTLWLLYNKRPASAGGEFDLPPGLGPDSASIWLRSSTDEGQSWTAPRELTAEVKDPLWAIASMGPGRGIQTRWAEPGRLVVPGWYTQDATLGSFAIYSDDDGESWTRGEIPEPWTDEAQVVELTDGTILLDGRQSGSGGTRLLYSSLDGGDSWSAAENGLAMTPVMSSVIRYSATRDGDDRDRLLHSGVDPSQRVDARAWYSLDEGDSWEGETVLREGFSQYTVLTRLDDGTIGMLVEGMDSASGDLVTDIRFLRFSLAAFGAD